MAFNYNFFTFTCPCGQVAHVVKVGITEDLKILFYWKCMKCREDICCLKTIEEVVAEAPAPEVPETATPKLLEGPSEPPKIEFTQQDRRLMKGIIKFDDEAEGDAA